MSRRSNLFGLSKKPLDIEIGRSFVSSIKKDNYHLVLSWGGLRGFAHIGIYKALKECGYTIASVAGTSMGSLVGVFIAAGKSPEDIEEIFTRKAFYMFLRPSFLGSGMLSARKIKKILKQEGLEGDISDLALPFSVCATDFSHAQALYYTSWSIPELVTASCAIPWLFNAVKYEGKVLIDGGVLDNLPISTAWELPIIAAHVNPRMFDTKNPLKDLSLRALEMMVARDVGVQSQACDIFIEPPSIAVFWYWLRVDAQKFIDIGYEHTHKLLEQ